MAFQDRAFFVFGGYGTIVVYIYIYIDCVISMYTVIKGTKLHFKSQTAERRHVLCVGIGGDRIHASRSRGARYVRLATGDLL